jgi:hypothetical protein
MGRILIAIGLVLLAIGVLMQVGVPLGRLPGDFTIRRGSVSFYFPLATAIIASIVLTVLFAFFGRR